MLKTNWNGFVFAAAITLLACGGPPHRTDHEPEERADMGDHRSHEGHGEQVKWNRGQDSPSCELELPATTWASTSAAEPE